MATTRDVPNEWAVAINGTPYVLDVGKFERSTMQVIRQQADSASRTSVASLNPSDLWRAFQDDWILGAGQEFFDFRGAQETRFWTSRGVNPWDRGKLKPLNDVTDLAAPQVSGAEELGKMVSTGARLYVIQGNTLIYWDGATWTSTSTTDASARTLDPIVDLATDGYNVFFTDGEWLYLVSEATDTPQRVSDLDCDSVGFVKGRLMVSAAADLYNITDIAPADPATNIPDPLGGLVNDQWVWRTWGEGPSHIYVGGGYNDKSAIWRIGIRDDATGLSAAAQATPLPDGEQIHAIQFYLGVVVLGTSKGVRIAVPQGQSLVLGDLIETDAAVYGLEPQGRFCWFTWTNPESGYTGLGRLDLSRFTQELVPAYATDLMHGAAGVARSVVTFGGKRVFVVEDVGVFEEDTGNLVQSWYATIGRITHRLPDDKVFHQLSVRHSALAAGESLQARLYVDDDFGGTTSLDETSDTDGDTEASWTTPNATGERALLRFDATGEVELERWMLRSNPVVDRTTAIALPLDLVRSATGRNDQRRDWTPKDEYEAIKALETDGQFVDVQLYDESFQAIIEQVQQGPDLREDEHHAWFEGPVTVVLKVFTP